MTSDAILHLRAGAVSVVIDATGVGLPRIVHWGADLGEALEPDAVLAAVTPPLERRLDGS